MKIPPILSLAFLSLASLTNAAPEPPDGRADILLITSAELEPAWVPFAEWKTSMGKPTRILTTSAIDSQFQGPDLPAKIRSCVQKYISEEGTTSVILGGDSSPEGGIVPDRDTAHITSWGEMEGIPTDIYYLSSKNWDADGDGIYGEWPDDHDAIEYPDGKVGLGRIPVRTINDVLAYTEKVIAYESRYPEGEFATEMVYTCTVPEAYPKLKRTWDEVVSTAWPDGKAQQFYSDKTPWDKEGGGDFDLSPVNWVNLVNGKTVGKFHLHGHGLRQCWVLEGNTPLGFAAVQHLQNQDAYPVITTVSCFTGQFDSEEDPCIGEQMLRQPRGGAVIVVAPSREGKPHFHDLKNDLPLMVKEGKPDGTTLTMARFWALGLGDKSDLDAGRSLMTVKSKMRADAKSSPNFHMCLCELNLLGDPTLDLRATSPTTIEAEFADSVEHGKSKLFTMKTNAPGATVCLWKPGEIFVVGDTGPDGSAKFLISPESKGQLSVAISGKGLNAIRRLIRVR